MFAISTLSLLFRMNAIGTRVHVHYCMFQIGFSSLLPLTQRFIVCPFPFFDYSYGFVAEDQFICTETFHADVHPPSGVFHHIHHNFLKIRVIANYKYIAFAMYYKNGWYKYKLQVHCFCYVLQKWLI